MSDRIILAMPVAAAFFIVIAYLLLGMAAAHISPPLSFTVNNSTYLFSSYALNLSQSEIGLMNATVTNSTFMLFELGPAARYPFWMKNTNYQLDIIWLNGNETGAKIVYIVNATPCAAYSPNQTACIIYTPSYPANYVIEAADGFVEHNKISTGDAVRFNYG
jgi:uncharacterized membrane protein (UPF0127 family)